MNLDLRAVAHALGGRVSGGQVHAPGPGHSPDDRSLSVKLNDGAPDGFVVFSFADDDLMECRDYVRKRIGLQAFRPNGRSKNEKDELIERTVRGADTDKRKGQIVATYDYTDADGKLLYQVVRYEPKDFRQRTPDGRGAWIWKLGEQRVLYRWPELLKYPDGTVFVCEGEKDANRIASLGHCATTVAAGKWSDECVEALAGRHIVILQDNDDAGRLKAAAAAQVLHRTAESIRIVALPDLPDKGDVSDWLDADPRRAERLVDVCFEIPVWTPETADSKASAGAKAADDAKPTDEPVLPFINISTWDSAAAPEREWVVPDRVPLKNVTLLSGDGGVGKSIIALHLAVATALGCDWLNALPTFGPVLVVCCEDDGDELHRRLTRIIKHCNAASGASFVELSKNMHILSLAGEDAVMAAPDRNGLIVPTGLFKRVSKVACDIRPRLIVIDNSADVFAGNENDRAQVRRFVTLLRGMAISANAGLLLTSHPSLTGISTGTGLSGSTAWNASVRSRLYLKRAKTDKDEEPDPDLRMLEVMKANYGPVGETITLRWNNGLFLPVSKTGGLEKVAAERRAEEVFLSLLEQFTRQSRNTCEKPTAPTYAPTLFAKENAARDLGIRKSDFEAAMRRLFGADKICLKTYGSPSRGTSRLVSRK
jgi:RecA-family ATPase